MQSDIKQQFRIARCHGHFGQIIWIDRHGRHEDWVFLVGHGTRRTITVRLSNNRLKQLSLRHIKRFTADIGTTEGDIA